MTPATTAEALASCSFCLKPHTDVTWLVAGPGVYICNECVDLCLEVAPSKSGGSRPTMPVWESQTDVEHVLQNLPRIAAAGAQVELNAHRMGTACPDSRRHLGPHRRGARHDQTVGLGTLRRRRVRTSSPLTRSTYARRMTSGRRTVLITGNPGSGKTAMVAESSASGTTPSTRTTRSPAGRMVLTDVAGRGTAAVWRRPSS